MRLFKSMVLFLGVAACVQLGAQNELRLYRETNGKRISLVEYSVSRDAKEVIVRSSGGGVANEIHWMPGIGTVSWRETDELLDNDQYSERTGDIIHMKGRFRGKEAERSVRVDSAPWYQIFGPIINDLLPPDLKEKEFWAFNPENFTVHKLLVRRMGTELLPFRGSQIEADKIHFSPAGALAMFWGADFWYGKQDGVWLYSRLPETRGVTVTELEEPGN